MCSIGESLSDWSAVDSSPKILRKRCLYYLRDSTFKWTIPTRNYPALQMSLEKLIPREICLSETSEEPINKYILLCISYQDRLKVISHLPSRYIHDENI